MPSAPSEIHSDCPEIDLTSVPSTSETHVASPVICCSFNTAYSCQPTKPVTRWPTFHLANLVATTSAMIGVRTTSPFFTGGTYSRCCGQRASHRSTLTGSIAPSIHPRWAGSLPKAKVLTKTSPSLSSGKGRSSMANVSGLIAPTGGLALTMTRVVLGVDMAWGVCNVEWVKRLFAVD
jgi:hypothetical protein